MNAKNLVVVAEMGNNDSITLVKIPRNLSNEGAKEMLERALRIYVSLNKKYDDGIPFVEVVTDEEFKKKFPIQQSKVIEICQTILKEIGHPLTVPALVWQCNCQNYLFIHPEFTKNALNVFSKPITGEEESFIAKHALERFIEILKWMKEHDKNL